MDEHTTPNPIDPQPPQDPELVQSSESLFEAPPPKEHDLLGKPPPPSKPDWSHRKAEPRMLALLWTIFLLVGTVLTFFSAGAGGLIGPDTYRPAAKLLLFTLMVGSVIAWPTIRLCQCRPREGGPRSVYKDLIVLLIPAQAIIWPQALLAQWSFIVLIAFDALLLGWTLLIGAIIALALGNPPNSPNQPIPRATTWSLTILAISLIGPIFLVLQTISSSPLPLLGPHAASTSAWMASPLTAVFELLRQRTWQGGYAIISPQHWAAIGAVWVAALLAWAAVLTLAALAKPKTQA